MEVGSAAGNAVGGGDPPDEKRPRGRGKVGLFASVVYIPGRNDCIDISAHDEDSANNVGNLG